MFLLILNIEIIDNIHITDRRFCSVLEQRSNNNKKKGGVIVFAVCIVIIIALSGMVIYLLTSRKTLEAEKEPVNRNVVVNEQNVEEVLAQLPEQKTPVGSYEVTMNSTWRFANGEAISENAYVENAEANTNSVYFDVTRADTKETLYESPILPVGSYLENIALDTKLSAGNYDCLITYHLLDEENISISTVKLTLTIIIEQ